MAILTLQQLVDANACESQRARFASRFGESVDVTEDLAVSVAGDFDFDFAARHFLPAAAWAEYEAIRAAAWAEYKAITAAAWAEYEAITAAAWAEYEAIRAAAKAEYDRIRAAAKAEYEAITAPAWAEYAALRARTFARLYNADAYRKAAGLPA